MSLVLSILRFLCKSIFTHLINVEGFRKFESEVKACNLIVSFDVSKFLLLVDVVIRYRLHWTHSGATFFRNVLFSRSMSR
jgi:hypothetical protein